MNNVLEVNEFSLLTSDEALNIQGGKFSKSALIAGAVNVGRFVAGYGVGYVTTAVAAGIYIKKNWRRIAIVNNSFGSYTRQIAG